MKPSHALRFSALSGSKLEASGESDDVQPTRYGHQLYAHRRLNDDVDVSNTSIDCSLGSSNDEGEDCPFASSYGCFNRPLQDRLTLYFGYEVFYTSLQPPLDFVQGSLLELVATSFNVTRDCSERRILQQAESISSLSSHPHDSVNTQGTTTSVLIVNESTIGTPQHFHSQHFHLSHGFHCTRSIMPGSRGNSNTRSSILSNGARENVDMDTLNAKFSRHNKSSPHTNQNHYVPGSLGCGHTCWLDSTSHFHGRTRCGH